MWRTTSESSPIKERPNRHESRGERGEATGGTGERSRGGVEGAQRGRSLLGEGAGLFVK